MKKILVPFFIPAILMTMAQSCFKGDNRVPPQVPGNETDIVFKNSVYDNQIYFDFGSGEIKAEFPNDSWIMAFDATPEGWEVKVNSGNLYAVAPTGVYDFNGVTPITSPEKYRFDPSDGNPDSSAFSDWLDRSGIPWEPTGEIFIIGQYDGIKYIPVLKVRIDSVNETAYSVTYEGMKTEPATINIEKDNTVNFVHVTIDGDSLHQVNFEPPKTDWDVLFSQYGTILYTDDGIPTPYFVRGVLLNPFNVTAALVTTPTFDSISYEDAQNFDYTSRSDLIGHDWKNPVIDFEANTVVYFVRKDTTFMIHDTEGLYFKMHFLNFYDSLGQIGYPEFEFLEL